MSKTGSVYPKTNKKFTWCEEGLRPSNRSDKGD